MPGGGGLRGGGLRQHGVPGEAGALALQRIEQRPRVAIVLRPAAPVERDALEARVPQRFHQDRMDAGVAGAGGQQHQVLDVRGPTVGRPDAGALRTFEGQRVAGHHRLFGGARLDAGAVESGGGAGVDIGVDRRDARDARLQQFDRRELARANQAPQLHGRQ
ncbi:hypothetical protein AYO32_11305 [Streptococcus pneumoniae]|nr:hypothetical protein AYO32_11305 [Streptococcus pneumoniae]